MTGSEQYFIAESIRHARMLPHSECVNFLRGLSMLLGDQDIVTYSGANLRAVINGMLETDAQLELITGEQLRFDLGEASR